MFVRMHEIKLGEIWVSKGELMEFVGIDIAKRKFDLTWLSGEKIKTKVLDNTDAGRAELLTWLKKNLVTNCES